MKGLGGCTLSCARHKGAGQSLRARKAHIPVGVLQSPPWLWTESWREGKLEAGRLVWMGNIKA